MDEAIIFYRLSKVTKRSLRLAVGNHHGARGSLSILPATFADINIVKERSVYYWLDGMPSAFDKDGYAIIDAVLDEEQCEAVADRVSAAGIVRAGSRNLLHDAWCADLAQYLKSCAAIAEHLPTIAVAAQCTLFDKSPARNWLVALHQDLSIPVREHITHSDCTGWSEKEGVLFVQPPLSLLESLVAVRVHLDECGPGAGPLRVVPGSHRRGRLSKSDARHQQQTKGEFECFANRGDALLMRPLLLHASSKATVPSRRRVLHFLFGPAELPHALRWHNAV